MTDESTRHYPATVDALLDNALGPQGYYGVFSVTCTPTTRRPRRRRRRDRRRGPGTRRPGHLLQADARPGSTGATTRRSAGSAGTRARSPSRPPSARAPTGSRRCSRPRARRHPQRHHARRHAGRLHGADDQGHPVRRFCSRQRHATWRRTPSRYVRLESRRRRSAVRAGARKIDHVEPRVRGTSSAK